MVQERSCWASPPAPVAGGPVGRRKGPPDEGPAEGKEGRTLNPLAPKLGVAAAGPGKSKTVEEG